MAFWNHGRFSYIYGDFFFECRDGFLLVLKRKPYRGITETTNYLSAPLSYFYRVSEH